MKAFNKLMICACSIATLTACSSEKDEAIQEQGVPMSISTEITQTRAAITGTSFSNDTKIGVYALNAEGTQYDNGSMNMLSQFNGTNWTFPTGSVYLKSADATVYAYYPYAISNSTTTVPIDITPDSLNDQTDYLYGTASAAVNSTNPKAQITFKHALARVTFSITRSDVGTGKGAMSSVMLKNVSTKTALSTAGTMDIKTGAITPTANTYATMQRYASATLNSTTPTVVEFMVIPVDIDNNVTLSIAIDDRMYDVVLPTTSLKAGNQYTFPVSVSIMNNKMTVGQCGITAWGSETASTTSVSDDNYTNDAYQAVDLGLSVKWATYNVGATKPEEYGGLYGWADITGTKTSTDYNDYPSANFTANISGDAKYDIARAKWGGKWRLPTFAEFYELYTNCSQLWTTVNGIAGFKLTSKKTGYTDKSIFLPASGKTDRKSNYYRGNYGYYMTGDHYDVYQNFLVYFYESSSLGQTREYRYIGQSVRPVTE